MPYTYGYARVSTKEQNEGRQIEKFKQLGIEKRDIFIDHASGKDFSRPEYERLKSILEEGDLVVIDAIDRLGRNYSEVTEEWRALTKDIGADIQVLEMDLLDTRRNKDLIGTFISDIILQILSYVAEQERIKIKQRQAEGFALAKAQGKKFGRPQTQLPSNFQDVYADWQAGLITAVKAQELLQLKSTTFYKLVTEYAEAQKHNF